MKCSGFRLAAASLVCTLVHAGPVGFASLDSSTTGGGEAPVIIVQRQLERASPKKASAARSA